jgi:transposase-like protein
MKTCPNCGGTLWRKGRNETSKGGTRYWCRDCKKSITVRDGAVVGDGKAGYVPDVNFGATTGRPMVKDWRQSA